VTLEARLEAFNKMRVALLDEMEATNPAALVAKPLAGKWSMLEIVEHLVLAERAVLKGLPDVSGLVENERALTHRVRYLLVMALLSSTIRVEVPSSAMVPRGGRTLADLRGLWNENQNWLRKCIDVLGPEGVRRTVFEHPIAGPLSVEQTVRMGQVHVEKHLRQIRALQRALA
jgi:hypothetical protein